MLPSVCSALTHPHLVVSCVSEIITVFLSQHRTPEEIAACEAVDTNTLRDPQVKKKKTTKGGGNVEVFKEDQQA